MCNAACLSFVERVLVDTDVRDGIILEVGSQDVNGSPRSIIERLRPSSYLGVDVLEGRGVDEVVDVSALVTRFGPHSFDVVISTEMVEHVRDWREAMTNLKRVVRPGGILVLTTRSRGYPYHGAPYDYWRYEMRDMADVFVDFYIEALESDPTSPGVFLKARKPRSHTEADLDTIRLYSILTRHRIHSLSPTSADLLSRWVRVGGVARNAARPLVPPIVKDWRRRHHNVG